MRSGMGHGVEIFHLTGHEGKSLVPGGRGEPGTESPRHGARTDPRIDDRSSSFSYWLVWFSLVPVGAIHPRIQTTGEPMESNRVAPTPVKVGSYDVLMSSSPLTGPTGSAGQGWSGGYE